MSYSFRQDLSEIRFLYDSGKNHFGNLPVLARSLVLDTANVQQVENISPKAVKLFKRMVVVMLCSIWEDFKYNLRSSDPTIYANHFGNRSHKWHDYNTPVGEVFLIRHCIAHAGGKIDQSYINNSKHKTFSTLGESVDLEDSQLDSHFKIFDDAYNQIFP